MAVMRLMRSGVWEIGLGLPAGFADSSPVSVRNLALYDLNFIVANELHAQFSEMFREQSESLVAETPRSEPWYESIDVEHAMFELVLSAYTAGALFMANAARTSFTKANSDMWEEDFDEAAKMAAACRTLMREREAHTYTLAVASLMRDSAGTSPSGRDRVMRRVGWRGWRRAFGSEDRVASEAREAGKQALDLAGRHVAAGADDAVAGRARRRAGLP